MCNSKFEKGVRKWVKHCVVLIRRLRSRVESNDIKGTNVDIRNWTQNAKNLIDKFRSFRQEKERLSWDEYYLLLAEDVSRRSLDAQTACGCVITDRQHRPLGFGYNSFVRGIDDSILPNLRPHKYSFMIHSELNAIFNCVSPPINGIAYITGPPCIHCLQSMWQSGIREIVFGGRETHMQQNDEQAALEEILITLMREQGLVYRRYEYGVREVRNQTVQAE